MYGQCEKNETGHPIHYYALSIGPPPSPGTFSGLALWDPLEGEAAPTSVGPSWSWNLAAQQFSTT